MSAWVISGHCRRISKCPLYPRKRTSSNTFVMSVKCHEQKSRHGWCTWGDGSFCFNVRLFNDLSPFIHLRPQKRGELVGRGANHHGTALFEFVFDR
jgi:hypothetical protein